MPKNTSFRVKNEEDDVSNFVKFEAFAISAQAIH